MGKRLPSIFTFENEILLGWINEARVSYYDIILYNIILSLVHI